MAVALFVQDIKNKFLDLIKFLISFGKCISFSSSFSFLVKK
ncbi:hypothetical protein H5410_028844 [Solanum commersonii]|uniref:Uncharacterized protein n=1 Tax=Solanum commersonii TaxID=4109 RepID=A0A9J5Z600_SOLCO|nr:hypothetical protein H5410_028844 [Solanum commersonii]